MGSSAQNSSGVHWCRRQSGSTRFRRRFRRRSGRLWCRARSGSTGFRRRFWRRSGRLWCRARLGSTWFQSRLQKDLGGFVAEPGQVQQGSGEGSGEGRGGFGAESGQVQTTEVPEKVLARFRRRSGRLWVQSQVRFNKVPEKVPMKVWEALAQSQVRFNKIPEKVPLKVWEALVQSQVKFNRVPRRFRRRSGRLCCRLSWGISSAWVAARFRKICKNKKLRLLGIPPKLIWGWGFLQGRG